MSPSVPWWGDGLGNLAVLLVCALAAWPFYRRAVRREREEERALRMLRDTTRREPQARSGCPFDGCEDPDCPNRWVVRDVRRGA